MPDTLSDVLIDARTALGNIGPPVKLDSDPDPPGEQPELIVLLDVADTGLPAYGLTKSVKRVQVTCYAETKLRALALTDAVRVALAGVGLRWRDSRPAPDPDYIGQISEYRR